jgi:signal transduction histidine kinase
MDASVTPHDTNADGGRRPTLRLKLLLALVVVALAGSLALVVVAELAAGGFYEAHMREMAGRFGDGTLAAMHSELRDGFLRALGQSLLVGLVVGLWLARRVIEPLEQVGRAARRIAAGAYSERLPSGQGDELGVLMADFNRMAATLEMVEARRSALIGTVAHELRTPLAGIQGYAEGLSDGLFPTAQAAEAIGREVARLKRLLDDLTEVSQVEAGALNLRLEPVELLALLAGLVERYQPLFVGQGGSLGWLGPDGPIWLQTDRDRLTQILVNLLANALKHAPSSQSEWRVVLQNQPQNQPATVLLALCDNGPGIAPQHLPHLLPRGCQPRQRRQRCRPHHLGPLGGGAWWAIAGREQRRRGQLF